jgi:lipopolysaccharide biosynthesis protein
MVSLNSTLQFAWRRARLWSDVWTSPKTADVQLLHVSPKRRTKLAILAHFDVHDRVDAYVLGYVRELVACGFDVALVSTCAHLEPRDLEEVRKWCCVVATRTNRGIDFGSWKVGLKAVTDWQTYERLLLANDSVFGPLFPLGPHLAKAESLDAGLVGMTDSHEFTPHLQSYFLLFNLERRGVASFVEEYFNRVRLLSGKQNAIWAYEVRLAPAAAAAGLSWRALFPVAEQPAYKPGAPFNSTHNAWSTLISSHQFPFLKRELLTRNPKGIPDTGSWPEVVAGAASNYETRIIRDYLERIRTP